MVPWLALFAIVPLLFAAAARGMRWAPVLLVVITASDLGYWGFHYLFGDPYRPLMTIDEFSRVWTPPESFQPGDLVDARLAEVPLQNALILRGFRVWRGYVGLPPALRLQNTDTAAETAGAKCDDENRHEPIPSIVERARLPTKARFSSTCRKMCQPSTSSTRRSSIS
jgi:hypothetical protein